MPKVSWATCAFLVCFASVQADQAQLSREEVIPEHVIARMDVDQDEFLSHDELSKFGLGDAGIQKSIDKDGDGRLSRSEFVAAVDKIYKIGGAHVEAAKHHARYHVATQRSKEARDAEFAKTDALFQRIDKDGSDYVSYEELSAVGFGQKSILKTLDVDGDGSLSRDEFDGAVAKALGTDYTAGPKGPKTQPVVDTSSKTTKLKKQLKSKTASAGSKKVKSKAAHKDSSADKDNAKAKAALIGKHSVELK